MHLPTAPSASRPPKASPARPATPTAQTTRGTPHTSRDAMRSPRDPAGTAHTIRSSYRFNVRVEYVFEQIACSEKFVLHGAEGKLLHRSDLLVGELGVMAK